MGDVIKQTKRVKKRLISMETYREYRRLKELYENDEELRKMRREIARLTAEGKNQEAENLRKRYNAHPLVNNYNEAKQEFRRLIIVVANIIQ